MQKDYTAVFFFAALFASESAVRGNIAFEHERSGAEQLHSAEQSFSVVPFGTTAPVRGLVLKNDGGCIDGKSECTFVDANHVQHYFVNGDGGLVVKSIELLDVGVHPITALGIGKARALEEVVERVRGFLPEAEVDCDEDAVTNETTCGATLGDGWIQLLFDGSRQLKEVRIDAYHFI